MYELYEFPHTRWRKLNRTFGDMDFYNDIGRIPWELYEKFQEANIQNIEQVRLLVEGLEKEHKDDIFALAELWYSIREYMYFKVDEADAPSEELLPKIVDELYDLLQAFDKRMKVRFAANKEQLDEYLYCTARLSAIMPF